MFEEVALRGDFEYEALIAEDPRYLETLNLFQMRITFVVKPQSLIFESGSYSDSDKIQFIDASVYENSELWTERQIFMFSSLAKKKQTTRTAILSLWYLYYKAKCQYANGKIRRRCRKRNIKL